MPNLTEVWSKIEWLINNGISIIPVRDKDDGEFLAKTPYRGWKKHQSEIIALPELWAQMDEHNTEAVASICGKVSGGLEIIDIDVKYKPGIDAVIMSDLRALYPDIFNRLRIHKTPSGGYHILYRVKDHEIPGNQKLAGRNKTADELELKPKPSTVNFIETRGEGGYAVAPPSLNYSVSHDNPILVLTWEERCSIISLCRTYSEIVDTAPSYKPTRYDHDYYDENPFDHFNKSPEAESVLFNNGWKLFKQSNQFIWFTRPGKDKGVSASFNKVKRIYFIFTSSTEFEENKGYNPATALSILQHGGDRKKTYQQLVSSGYGKIKQSVETRIAKAKAITGKPLPKNASESAKQLYVTTKGQIAETYPYGIFWEYDDEGKIIINREKLYTVSDGLGFKVHNQSPVRLDGYIIRKQEDRQFYDAVKSYIKEEDGDEYISICNCYETFIEKHGSFTITRLQSLDTTKLVRDTSNSCYKFYHNGYLFITGQDVSFHTYDTLSGIIWEHDILDRQYSHGPEGGRYHTFLKLATNWETQSAYIRKIIGYLSHQFKDETTAYIIVLTEQCEDPKQGGGSGKNIFSSLFRFTTTYKSIPGSQVNYDEKFMQAWNGERIFAISDTPKRFDFSFLKEPSSGTGILKKLFKDQLVIEVADMPKFLIQTNFSFEVIDGGLKRRIIPIEFTDFFTKSGGVDVHFNGTHFPKGWELPDWIGFDNMVANCIKEWLAGGLKLHPLALTEGGWLKQFEQTWGAVITGIIHEYFDKWLALQWVSNDNFKKDMDDYFRENNTAPTYRPAMRKVTEAVSEWANHYKKQFLTNVQKRENGISVKMKWFGNELDTPF